MKDQTLVAQKKSDARFDTDHQSTRPEPGNPIISADKNPDSSEIPERTRFDRLKSGTFKFDRFSRGIDSYRFVTPKHKKHTHAKDARHTCTKTVRGQGRPWLFVLLQPKLGVERLDEAAGGAPRAVLSDRPLQLSREWVLQARRRRPPGASHAAHNLPRFLDVQT